MDFSNIISKLEKLTGEALKAFSLNSSIPYCSDDRGVSTEWIQYRMDFFLNFISKLEKLSEKLC